MRTVTTKIYKIDEHPNKDLCFKWINDNWHDLNQYTVDEVIASLKALQERIGGDLDYSIGQFPDRGEFLSFRNFDWASLNSLDAEKCSLTGTWCDQDVIEGIKDNDLRSIFNLVHESSEYTYSDKGLEELCLGNDYEFTEDGKIYSKVKVTKYK